MKALRGFTLLELLIGMTLLGFILALLFGGFRLASSSWDAVESKLEGTTDEQLARSVVRRILLHLQPLRWQKNPNKPVTFVGNSQMLRAVAPIARQGSVVGLRVIEIGAEQEGNSSRLVLRHATLNYGANEFSDPLAETKGHLLLEDLRAVTFAYFGPGKKGEPPQWQENWNNPEQLPQLIRISMPSKNPGWADLMVAPVITGNRSASNVAIAGPF